MSVERVAESVRLRDADRRTVALLAPLLVLDVVVFAVPFGYLLRLSVTGRTDRGAFQPGTVSLDGYAYLLDSPTVVDVVVFTAWFAVVVTLLAVCIAVVYAYAVWRADGVLGTVLLSGVVVSLLTTLVVKLFAVVLVFSPVGVFNDLLLGVGVVAEPLRLVSNETGAVVAQLYVVVPYAVLAVYSVLDGLNEQLIEAARDLGAGRFAAVRAVVLPHVVPGVVVAAAVSFAWSVGAYAAPLLVGSSGERTAGVYVSELLLRRYDWPAAAALAVVTVVAVTAVLGVAGLVLARVHRGTGRGADGH
jgi:spermidine/putrescine transport system permease protein